MNILSKTSERKRGGWGRRETRFCKGKGGGGRGPETELVYLESYIITLIPALNKFHKASCARLVGG